MVEEDRKRIGKYEVLERLGRGGMGEVYKARLPIVDEVVAVKILSPIDAFQAEIDELRSRFVREAKILWKIRHPNIVPITDVDEIEGSPFYVMEYLPTSLADELGIGDKTGKRKEPLGEKEIQKIAKQVLEALVCLHAKGIVHRDIKPANILVAGDGSVKLADFGIAKIVDQTGYTKTRAFLGTYEFMAPEQGDAKSADHRADLYSVAMVLYLMLTGQHPYVTRFEKPSAVRQGLASGWDELIRKGTAPKPEDRFQSAEEMLTRLESVFSDQLGGELAQVRKDGVGNGGAKPEGGEYQLRSQPQEVSPRGDFGFFKINPSRRPLEYIEHKYEDNGDGTVTDHATGLMWEQSGSRKYYSHEETNSYIEELNGVQFAGYRDWRLPTADELMSLIAKTPIREETKIAPLRYVERIFDTRVIVSWTSDKVKGLSPQAPPAAWFVNFLKGTCEYDALFGLKKKNAVRAVRSLHKTQRESKGTGVALEAQKPTESGETKYEKTPAESPKIEPGLRPKYELRSEPRMVMRKREVLKQIFGVDDDMRPLAYVENSYQDNKDGTVTDHATGLMWESESKEIMSLTEARVYIRELNGNRFAGHNDWRLPTVNELMSLLEPEKGSNDLYLNPMFNWGRFYWSVDTSNPAHGNAIGWYLDFREGCVAYFATSGRAVCVGAVRNCRSGGN